MDRLKKSGAVHFAGLENNVAVAEKDGGSPGLDVLNDVERVVKKALGKRIVDEKARDGQQAQVMRILASVTLQGAQIIHVTKFCAQLFENGPVALRPFWADLALEKSPQVGDDAVVVEQRVVNVEQENDFAGN
jgi:hypothetical protein